MEGSAGPIALRVQRLPEAEDLPLPTYATCGAAGLDIRAAITETLTLQPGDRAVVPTGLRIAVPPGFEGQVRPRSGLAARHGVGLVNSPGTVDSDFRGEVKVVLVNWGAAPVTIRRGDRIAQLVVCPIVHADVIETDTLESTGRGHGGFGHTGIE